MFTPLVNLFNAANAEIDRLIFDVWLAWLADQLGPTPFWYALVIGIGVVTPFALAFGAYLLVNRLWPQELMDLKRRAPSAAGAGEGRPAESPAPATQRSAPAAASPRAGARAPAGAPPGPTPAPAAQPAAAQGTPATATAQAEGSASGEPGSAGKPAKVSDSGRPISPRGKVAKPLGG